jgi:cytochrome c553
MFDGYRMFAILFAIISLLTPGANLSAGAISDSNPRIVIAQNCCPMSSSGPAVKAKAAIKPQAQAKVAVTPQARAAAADIFESRCVACHGAEGRGDGPAAANLNPKPMNFHNSRWQKTINDATIARAIVFGGQTVGVSGEMAPNPDLEDEPAVVAALVERVRQLSK